ncbi:2-succinyl-5-enolpyruvyl-6-hydroxy-3-cyclohexene-1-carboxylic-acid synthase [Vibrio sp. CAU 1672]|uniref:2-succinyl-5-enolpyruvyl-6-hydroxy-3- cyclohexene-1-carboxylic-acid synthase n=1 Tax=Vibrio sp. CAU 1672 TaxID=3032594 RepID=UPI0023DAE022|nr:2-succinyl-5-enolpyruvyl-6-hydroxy-3-cyclohexene-1-carboxylic-acid synthase [Vibrio sp. CAU 1672]MDF2153588.1 2-succinyl-5-enolpyruvyl-6-hydroxy-3-cyclohexene-1-carboxylic-acid synthase [Vibrio sp. CAU 1672]
MNPEQAGLNRIWAQTLLTELQRFGVQHICIAPGSRSAPLTLEAAQQSGVKLHTHFDERGLGFLALGLAKASAAPVALIVTSGTAVANLLPSIAEAKLTGEKLVVLTADRPIELVGCGANQAIEQEGIFSSHVSASLNLPSPTLSTPLSWLLTSVDEVMFTQQLHGSAVHINCAFPEPLYGDAQNSAHQAYRDAVAAWRESGQPYCQRLAAVTSAGVPAFKHKKGLVVIGSLPLVQAQAALAFAEQMGWPVLADPQSGVSSSWAQYDLWLQQPKLCAKLAECDLVVQFGSRIISKRLNQWLARHLTQTASASDYWFVSERLERNNQHHLPQLHWAEAPSGWIARAGLPDALHAGWADDLLPVITQVHRLSQSRMDESRDNGLSEQMLAIDCAQRTGDADLFLGNSLFVRLIDMFAQLSGQEVFTNRGASGIDGLLATANGIQRSRQKPMLMFIGDTSALYDLNSLALFSQSTQPVVIVITNNDGGAIFDLLPVPQEQKQTYYQMPHGYTFEYAARQFHLAYYKPVMLSEYQAKVSEHLQHGTGTLIVEVQTPPHQAAQELKQFQQQLHASL